jgi:hypothetical protein
VRHRDDDAHGWTRELGLELDIAYRGFQADGALLLPEYVDGMANVDDENVDSGSRTLQRDFVEMIQRCNRLVSSSFDVGGEATTTEAGDVHDQRELVSDE